MTVQDGDQCREASPEECRRAIEEEQCRIVDVRTPAEFGQGHLENAMNIDYYAPDFRERIAALDREHPYVIYCKKGARGAKAMDILKQAGFRRVYNIAGGVEGWTRAGLPLRR